MDIVNKSSLSLQDFLAYFFPGALGTFGIIVLLALIVPNLTITILNLEFSIAITVYISISYMMGVIFSGLSSPISILIRKIMKLQEPTNSLPFRELSNEIENALKDFLEIKELKLTSEHFYLCRSIVRENVPAIAYIISRQVGLRQFRENIIIPIVIWAAAGIIWGSKEL